MFFVRRKKVVFDCFTFEDYVYEYSKIAPAKQFIPDWWRKLPLPNKEDFNPKVNLRHCPGFIDHFMRGFAIPLWSDLNLKIGPVGQPYAEWRFSDGRSEIDFHNPEQWGDFFSENTHQHLKISTPWVIKTKHNIDMLWSEPTWNILNSNVRVLPGVFNFKYQHSTNLNIVVAREREEKIHNLKFNTPLAHMTPATEKKVVLKYHLISKEEFSSIESLKSQTFVGGYNIRKLLVDSKKKCPFHRN